MIHYGFSEEDPSTQLKIVCENMKDQIVKVLKVPFTSSKPESPYVLHATADFEIGGDKDKADKDKKKGKDEGEKQSQVENETSTAAASTENGKITAKKPQEAAKKNATANPKKGADKKKDEVKIEKEEKLEAAGKITINIFKK